MKQSKAAKRAWKKHRESMLAGVRKGAATRSKAAERKRDRLNEVIKARGLSLPRLMMGRRKRMNHPIQNSNDGQRSGDGSGTR